MIVVNHLSYQAPISALEFIHQADILLCGSGPYLLAYDLSSTTAATQPLPPPQHTPTLRSGDCRVMDRVMMRPDSRVHGIRVFPSTTAPTAAGKVLIYGGKYLTIIEYTRMASINNRLFQSAVQIGPFPDWILDAVLLHVTPTASSALVSQVAVAFAHNYVDIYRLPTTGETINTATSGMRNGIRMAAVCITLPQSQWALVHSVKCQEQCMLWSARFHGHGLDDLIVAVGTVFNHCLIWSPVAKGEMIPISPVLYRMTGHEGMVFRVRFTTDASQLISASDDRFIRVWQLPSRDDLFSGCCGVTTSSSPVYRGLGGRAWDAVMSDQYLVAVGEDSTVRVWDRQSEQVLTSLEGHSGKSIRHLAITTTTTTAAAAATTAATTATTNTLVASGGDDGCVRLWRLNEWCTDPLIKEFQPPTPLLNDNGDKSKLLIRDFHSNGSLLAVGCSDGNIYIQSADILGQSPASPIAVVHRDCKGLASFASLQLSRCGEWLFIANHDGELTVLRIDKFTGDNISPVNNRPIYLGGLRNRILLFDDDGIGSDDSTATTKSFYLISHRTSATNHLHCEAFLYHITVVSADNSLIVVHHHQLVGQFDLSDSQSLFPNVPLSLISAELRTVSDQDEVIVFMGMNSGELLAYRYDCCSSDKGANNDIPRLKVSCKLKLAHGMNSIQSMVAGESRGDIRQFHLYTCARDCNVLKFKVCFGDKQQSGMISIALLHTQRSPAGNVPIDTLLMIDGVLHGLAFRHRIASLWNCETEEKVFSIECSGVGRRYCLAALDGRYLTFAFMRGGGLFQHYRVLSLMDDTASAACNQRALLFDGFKLDGRELRCIQHLYINGKLYLLTAGEGGRVHILEMMTMNRPRTSMILDEPKSVVTALQLTDSTLDVYRRNDDAKLLFGCGGREELFCWRLLFSEALVGHNSLIGAPLLAAAPSVSSISDIRIMDICCYPLTDKSIILIGAVNSDGVFRLWSFNERTNCFISLAAVEFTKRCPQRVICKPVGDSFTGTLLFYLTATDGRLTVLKACLESSGSATLSPLDPPLQLHQSGIAAICLNPSTTPGQLTDGHGAGCSINEDNNKNSRNAKQKDWLCTGGDDQDIVITKVYYNPAGGVQPMVVLHQKRLVNTHSSTIKSIQLIPLVDAGNLPRFFLVSASIDQRLNIWLVEEGIDNDDVCIKTTLLHSCIFSILDISSIAITRLLHHDHIIDETTASSINSKLVDQTDMPTGEMEYNVNRDGSGGEAGQVYLLTIVGVGLQQIRLSLGSINRNENPAKATTGK